MSDSHSTSRDSDENRPVYVAALLAVLTAVLVLSLAFSHHLH